jgi:hypothetical protein
MLVVKRMTVEMEFIHAHPNYFIGVFSIGMDVKKMGNFYSMAYGPYDFIQRRWEPICVK